MLIIHDSCLERKILFIFFLAFFDINRRSSNCFNRILFCFSHHLLKFSRNFHINLVFLLVNAAKRHKGNAINRKVQTVFLFQPAHPVFLPLMAGAGNLFLPSALPVRKGHTAVLPYHAHLVSSPVLLLDLDFIRPDHIAPCHFRTSATR